MTTPREERPAMPADRAPEPHIPAAGEASVPEIEADENVAPRPEEDIADVARAKPDVTEHAHPGDRSTSAPD